MHVDPNGDAWYHWAVAAGIVMGIGIALVCTVGTAGALSAVMFAAYGLASASMSSTILSFAIVGSGLALAGLGLYALGNSRSVDDFFNQGNWGTVAYTAFGGSIGALGGYLSHEQQMGSKQDWNKIRKDYWKSQGYSSGKAPLGTDGYKKVLHHTYGRNGSKMFIFEPMTRTDHIALHQMYGYGIGQGGYNQNYQFFDWWWLIRRI